MCIEYKPGVLVAPMCTTSSTVKTGVLHCFACLIEPCMQAGMEAGACEALSLQGAASDLLDGDRTVCSACTDGPRMV